MDGRWPTVPVRVRDGRSWLVLRSEFAMVELAVDSSGSGPALVVRDAETGDTVSLDPLELEALTRVRHAELARFIPR